MLSEDELDDLIADTNFQHGRDYERERIIALLELEASELEAHDCADDCKIRAEELRLGLALIKGENK